MLLLLLILDAILTISLLRHLALVCTRHCHVEISLAVQDVRAVVLQLGR
jgi:hypothetical protein